MQWRTTRWKSHAMPKIATVRHLLAQKSTATRLRSVSGTRKRGRVSLEQAAASREGTRKREKEKTTHLKATMPLPPPASFLNSASLAHPLV
jgi:hypothetical protein